MFTSQNGSKLQKIHASYMAPPLMGYILFTYIPNTVDMGYIQNLNVPPASFPKKRYHDIHTLFRWYVNPVNKNPEYSNDMSAVMLCYVLICGCPSSIPYDML